MKRKKPSNKAKPNGSVKAIVKSGPPTVSEAIENVLIKGDLSPLSAEQRLEYYKAVCKSLGVNMLTNPFGYILFKESENAVAKLVLYAKKDCAEQLRKIHGVSVIPNTTKRIVDEEFATTELAVRDRTGKTDTATGIVYLWRKHDGKSYRLAGQKLADAIMKSETKAKRRATLSVCGLGMLDEMDLESVKVVGGVTSEGRIFHYPGAEDIPGTGSHEAAVETGARKVAELRKRLGKPDEALKSPPIEESESVNEPPKASIPDLPPMPDHDDIDDVWPKGTTHSTDSPSEETPTSSAKTGGKPAAKGRRGSDSASHTPPAAEVLSGTIQHFVTKMTKGSARKPSQPFMSVLLKTEKGDRWYSVFDRDLFPFLSKGKGKHGEFLIQQSGDFWNLLEIRRLGNIEFEENAPVIQQSTREAGTKSLYD
jgi:hypothetical protein